MKPVTVLGFGRSGTTWLADIISKILGGLILFEPLHPSVTDRSRQMSYRRTFSAEENTWLEGYIDEILSKRREKLWLMRNHVPVPIDQIDHDFYEYLWENCNVVGFKDIRMNYAVPWLAERDISRLVYIVRDPRAVVASILNRPNFWEFGWPGTYDLMVGNLLDDPTMADHPIQEHAEMIRSVDEDFERIAMLWTLSHRMALSDCIEWGVPIISYEDLYANPFETIEKLVECCDLPKRPLHPSYIFSPSLTTKRTFHGIYSIDKRVNEREFSFFWNQTLSTEQCARIEEIMTVLGLRDGLYDGRSNWNTARAPHQAAASDPHVRIAGQL